MSYFASDFGALYSNELVFFPHLVGLGFIHCLLYLFGLSEPTSVDLQGDIKSICILIFGTNEFRIKLFQHFICTILEKFFWTVSFAREYNSFVLCICRNLVDNIVVIVSVFSCQSLKVFGQVALHELLHNWVRRFDVHFDLLIKIIRDWQWWLSGLNHCIINVIIQSGDSNLGPKLFNKMNNSYCH